MMKPKSKKEIIMSSNKLERIKGLRVKGSNSYLDLIPFGTSGQLIDRFFGLDLEEELQLSGNSYVEIKEQPNEAITIEERYYSEPKNGRIKEQMY